MAAEKAISYKLRATPAVTALCGGAVSPRVWLGQRRQGTALPAITVELDTTDPSPGDTKDGASALDNDFVFIFNYANTLEAALSLADACRTAIDKAMSGTINTVKVQTAQFVGRNYFQDGQDPITHVYEDHYKVRVTRP